MESFSLLDRLRNGAKQAVVGFGCVAASRGNGTRIEQEKVCWLAMISECRSKSMP